MASFIALSIMRQADISLQNGQTTYRAYFINTTLYASYKTSVDTILQTTTSEKYPSGYGACIVTA